MIILNLAIIPYSDNLGHTFPHYLICSVSKFNHGSTDRYPNLLLLVMLISVMSLAYVFKETNAQEAIEDSATAVRVADAAGIFEFSRK